MPDGANSLPPGSGPGQALAGTGGLNGGVRVATIASASGIEHVILPQAWLDRRAALARLFGDARVLADHLADHPGDDPGNDRARQWRRMRQRYAHGLDEVNAERREFYRKLAKRLSERFGVIAIDMTGAGRLSRRKQAADSGTDAPPLARRMRSWAAPAQLIGELERAGRARGCRVELASGKSTVHCHLCGADNTYTAAARQELVLLCDQCRASWDQDVNAAVNLYAAARDASAAAALGLEARQNKGLRASRLTRKRSAREPPANLLEPDAP